MKWGYILGVSLSIGCLCGLLKAQAVAQLPQSTQKACGQLKSVLIREEQMGYELFQSFFKISDAVWQNIISHKNQIIKSIKKHTFKAPAKQVYRDPKIPQHIIAHLETIAQEYGIHPKSMHIKISAHTRSRATKNNGIRYVPAYIEYPVCSSHFQNGSLVKIELRKSPVIFLHPLFIQNFNENSVKTLRHEMMHLRELNGLGYHIIVSEIERLGYRIKKASHHSRVKKIATYCTKLYERNTDLLVALESKSAAQLVYKASCSYCQNSFDKGKHDDGDHFSHQFISQWANLILQAYDGVPFVRLLPQVSDLQKEQLRRVV